MKALKLAVLARRACKERFSEGRLLSLDRQIEQGQLTLADLEGLCAEGGSQALPTVLAVIFGAVSPDEAALDFLAHPERDNELTARKGEREWQQFLRNQYGLPVPQDQPLADTRSMFARHILCGFDRVAWAGCSSRSTNGLPNRRWRG